MKRYGKHLLIIHSEQKTNALNSSEDFRRPSDTPSIAPREDTTTSIAPTEDTTTIMLPLHKQQKHTCSACGFETTDIFELLNHYESFV